MFTLKEILGNMWYIQPVVVVVEDRRKNPLEIEPVFTGENWKCRDTALLNRYVKNYGAHEGKIYICLMA